MKNPARNHQYSESCVNVETLRDNSKDKSEDISHRKPTFASHQNRNADLFKNDSCKKFIHEGKVFEKKQKKDTPSFIKDQYNSVRKNKRSHFLSQISAITAINPAANPIINN